MEVILTEQGFIDLYSKPPFDVEEVIFDAENKKVIIKQKFLGRPIEGIDR